MRLRYKLFCLMLLFSLIGVSLAETTDVPDWVKGKLYFNAVESVSDADDASVPTYQTLYCIDFDSHSIAKTSMPYNSVLLKDLNSRRPIVLYRRNAYNDDQMYRWKSYGLYKVETDNGSISLVPKTFLSLLSFDIAPLTFLGVNLADVADEGPLNQDDISVIYYLSYGLTKNSEIGVQLISREKQVFGYDIIKIHKDFSRSKTPLYRLYFAMSDDNKIAWNEDSVLYLQRTTVKYSDGEVIGVIDDPTCRSYSICWYDEDTVIYTACDDYPDQTLPDFYYFKLWHIDTEETEPLSTLWNGNAAIIKYPPIVIAIDDQKEKIAALVIKKYEDSPDAQDRWLIHIVSLKTGEEYDFEPEIGFLDSEDPEGQPGEGFQPFEYPPYDMLDVNLVWN